MKRRPIRSLWWAALLSVWPVQTGQAAPKTDLPRALQQTLEQQIVPAYMRGDPQWLVTSLSELVARATPERVEQIDQALAGEHLPPVSDLLLESRLSLVMQGRSQVLPQPHPREMLLTIGPVERAIQETLDASRSVAILSEQLPKAKNFQAFEEMFWEAHVFSNRLRTARMLAEYGQAMVREARGLPKGQVADSQQSVLQTDFSALDEQMVATGLRLEERALELRLQRLEFAAHIDAKNATFRERLMAAFVGDLDGELLERFFTENKNYSFQEDRLRAPGVLRDIRTRSGKIRREAGDLVQKGRLLYEGLHWWMRGRYGQGPEGNGMLKSPLALTNPVALFALYMPTETPKPTDPYDNSQSQLPEIDRRHHYIWQFEYRRIGEQWSRKTETKGESLGSRVTSVTKFDRFY